MYFKTKKELDQFINTTGEGTKENPKVKQLPWNYKIPLYLGYAVKWDYSWDVKSKYDPYSQYYEWEIKPEFKKSSHRFDCKWDYVTWDFLMDDLLPKMEEDGLIYDKLRGLILSFNREEIIVDCYHILNVHIPDMKIPFVNISDPVESFHPDKIF